MLTIGVDVGTTTTHFAVHRVDPGEPPSRGGFFAPSRTLVAESPAWFTPWRGDGTLDGAALLDLHRDGLAAAGIEPSRIAAGAAIVTGEAARAGNSGEALSALSVICGSMVPVIAGGWTESVLAGKGSGALADSRDRLRTTAALDIGGGTSNIALFRSGEPAGACNLRLGGRMVRFDGRGRVVRRTEAASRLARIAGWECEPGVRPSPGQLEALAGEVARGMVRTLEGGVPDPGWTDVPWDRTPCGPPDALYVSGGVGELLHRPGSADPGRFLDLGVEIARALSRELPAGLAVPLPTESVRATAVGIGEHALRIAGATVHDSRSTRGPILGARVVDAGPIGIPPAEVPPGPVAWRLRWGPSTGFDALLRSARALVAAAASRGDRDLLAVLEADLAKACSVAIRLAASEAGWRGGVVCLDGLPLDDADFLDVGQAQEEGAIPVVLRRVLFAGDGCAPRPEGVS